MPNLTESNQQGGNAFPTSGAAEAGSQASDFEACDTSGRVVRVSNYWQDSPVVVVFLRYLGCTFCREQVIALRDNYKAIEAAGAQVVCVAMGGDKVGQAFQVMFALPYPLLMLGESDTRPYRQYGLAKGTFMQLLGPRLFVKGFAAMRSLGNRTINPAQPGDKMQLSGTFIIDKGGTIRLAYRSRDAADNAPIPLVLQILERLKTARA